MPQEFQVLRCSSCETFQVDIVKMKNVKWECKLCGLKQSIKHVYGKSSAAKECRVQVQMLNIRRGDMSADLKCDNNKYFAQQLERFNESCLDSFCDVDDIQNNVVEDNNSLDSMTSPNIRTSRTSYDTTTSTATAFDDGLKPFETTEGNQKQKQTRSKWAKYLVSESEEYD